MTRITNVVLAMLVASVSAGCATKYQEAALAGGALGALGGYVAGRNAQPASQPQQVVIDRGRSTTVETKTTVSAPAPTVTTKTEISWQEPTVVSNGCGKGFKPPKPATPPENAVLQANGHKQVKVTCVPDKK